MTIRIDLTKEGASSQGIFISNRQRGSPLCRLCRRLISELNFSREEPTEVWRNETLCFAKTPLGWWADRTVDESETARFVKWVPFDEERFNARKADSSDE